jgi:hypothetical protein
LTIALTITAGLLILNGADVLAAFGVLLGGALNDAIAHRRYVDVACAIAVCVRSA